MREFRFPLVAGPVAAVGEPRVQMLDVVRARTTEQERAAKARMEVRAWHGENELPTAAQHARNLGDDGANVVDVLEHGDGQHPVERRIALRDALAASLVDGCVDTQ